MTAPNEHTSEPHSLRAGIFMLVVVVVQGFDLILDGRIDHFTREDGREFRDLASFAGDSASAICLILLVTLASVLIRDQIGRAHV